MKTQHCLGSALIAALVLLPAATRAEQDVTNRFSVSLLFGLNISARFTGAGGLPLPVNTRKTPDGAAYNYDDGYVLADVSGDVAGQTWNWGYHDSARQVVGNTIEFSRSTPSPGLRSPGSDDAPNPGIELAYRRQFGHLNHDKWHWGFEAAASYTSLLLRDTSTYSGPATVDIFPHPFADGTMPPTATQMVPYQGTFGGPGFVINDTPVGPSSSVVPNGVTIAGVRELSADLWGFRVGPYVEIPLAKNFNLSISGGLAVAVLDSDAKWSETVTVLGGSASGSGKGSDSDVRWGGYAAASLAWQFSERWSLSGGVQYQNLGTSRRTLGGRGVEVDLSNSIFVSIGVGYNF